MTETKMQLVDWLDDLCVRFIINLPREELESVERICFQVEEAQWFYEDFIRPLDPTLPSLNLKQFCLKIFQHCPLFSVYDVELHSKAFSEFLAYKTRVPVRGAILLNETLDEVVLVKGYKKGSSWSFPRGKINKDERDIDCAIREVYEETGYDIRRAGLINREEDIKSIDITMREQNMKLFVFPGVPQATHFEPRTRKEISKIEWYKLSDLPTLKRLKQQHHQYSGTELAKNANKFYMVAPFLVPLKKYIAQMRKRIGLVSHAKPQIPYFTANEVVSDYISAPVVDTEVSLTDSDMDRLMAQLRQSQQASRENNFPEVSDRIDSANDASLQLKHLSNFQPIVPSQSAKENDSAVMLESKASAMLRLLRGHGQSHTIEPPPSTPYDQITGQPKRPPPSPRHQASQAERTLGHPELPVFPFSPTHVSRGEVRRPELFANPHSADSLSNRAQSQLPEDHRSQSSLARQFQPRQAPIRPIAAEATKWIDDPYFPPNVSPDSQITDDRRNIGPPPSKLPIPKLNAHSSALLSLFKGIQQVKQAEQIPVAQLPAENLANFSELSTSRPTTVSQSQHAFNKPTLSDMKGPSSALVSSSPGAMVRLTPKSTSQHQENLLNLFRLPTLGGKSSPSLVPPSAPVELAANQLDELTQAPGSQKLEDREASKPTFNSSRKVIKKRPEDSIDFSRPNLSATVSGPLNVPQFESIHKPSAKKSHSTSQNQMLRRGPGDSQPPIRILARPASSHKSNSGSDEKLSKLSEPRESSHRSLGNSRPKSWSRDSPRPFQPQILKRPTDTVPVKKQSIEPQAQPQAQPQKILTRPTAPEDRSQGHSLDQKAVLLSLFGRSNTNLSSEGLSGGLPVSPLSEKPAVDSALVSPTGAGRSRIGSIQSLEGEGFQGGERQAPKITASPHDRQFLLGFLDEVARESRR